MKKIITKRFVVGAISLALVLSAFMGLVGRSSDVQAALSLPFIEQLKNSTGGACMILEIVPDADQGSIGYYIDGYEPCASWPSEASDIANADKTFGVDENLRQTAVNDRFVALENKEIISTTANKAPLLGTKTNGRYYNEYFPWDEIPEGAQTLALNKADSWNVRGILSDAENGEYSYLYDYDLIEGDSANGEYVQKILKFENYSAKAEQNGYFYQLTADRIYDGSGNELQLETGDIIYEWVQSPSEYEKNYDIVVGDIYLKYHGVYGYDDITFKMMERYKTYYKVNTFGKPSAAYDATSAPFFAVVPQSEDTDDQFREKNVDEEGWFSEFVVGCQYVGGGGDCNLQPDSHATNMFLVRTETVFYVAGYTNNDWMLKHVFDWEEGEGEPLIRVNTVSAKDVIVDAGTVSLPDVAGASIIVLNSGFTEGKDPPATYSTENDISDDVRNAIKEAVNPVAETSLGRPCIIDGRLAGTETNVQALAASIKQHHYDRTAREENAFAWDNVLYIDHNLATNDFYNPDVYYETEAYGGDQKDTSNPFYKVYKEIKDANINRKFEHISEELPEVITLATSIRYILNTSNRATIKPKNIINVLDIEPGYNSTTLTTEKVRGSLYVGSDVQVNIKTMSVNEFNGKIENLSETYDLIYLGANIDSFDTKYNNDRQTGYMTDYADDDMDGLIYTNIGDRVIGGNYKWGLPGLPIDVKGWDMSGLLDRDYMDGVKCDNDAVDEYTAISRRGNTARTFRYSGNDITEKKMNEIIEFADSGYPVIIANNLTTDIRRVNGDSQTAEVTLQWRQKIFGKWGDWHNLLGTYKYKVLLQGDVDDMSIKAYLCESGDLGQAGRITRATFNWYVERSDGTVEALPPKEPQPMNITGFGDRDNKINEDTTCSVLDIRNGQTGDKYYCEVTADTIKYLGIDYTVGDDKHRIHPNKNPATFYKYQVLTFDANPKHVDNCSRAYELLMKLCDKKFVMSEWQIDEDAYPEHVEILRNCVNRSKPTIFFDDTVVSNENIYKEQNRQGFLDEACYPTVYSIDEENNMTSMVGDELVYVFHIKNPNEVTDTKYRCKLYMDDNGDGLYSENEQLRDILLYEFDGWADDDRTEPLRGRRVFDGELRSNTVYVVSRRLAEDKIGIIPWKLEISDITPVTQDKPQIRTHASSHNYTRRAPEEGQVKPLYILQINEEGGVDLSTHSTFQKYINRVNDFDLRIFTITVDQINTLAAGNYDNENTILQDVKCSAKEDEDEISLWEYMQLEVASKDKEPFTNKTTWTNTQFRSAFFKQFDMLILGFKDSYQELDIHTSRAVSEYIGMGKPCLFSHDTASYYCLPNKYQSVIRENFPRDYDYVFSGFEQEQFLWGIRLPAKGYGHGYFFNTVIRSAVGLDVYGVTDPVFGISKYRTDLIAGGHKGTVAASYAGMTPGDEKGILQEGYSIAKKPGSGTRVTDRNSPNYGELIGYDTIPETQGFSTGILLAKWIETNNIDFKLNNNESGGPTGASNDGDAIGGDTILGLWKAGETDYDQVYNKTYQMTTKVSQVNEGQITTYPYNINLSSFQGAATGAGNALEISRTHNQYYQLNLNLDDIVVWYCLADDGTDHGSGRNVYGSTKNDVVNNYYIYSRANVTYTGFGHSYNVSDSEAQLFVNTMIAAYRIAATRPEVDFTDESGVNVITNELIPSDGGKILDGALNDEDRKIYFTVYDRRVGKPERMDWKFEYSIGSETCTLHGLQNKVYKQGGIVAEFPDGSGEILPETGFESGKTYYIKLSDLVNALGIVKEGENLVDNKDGKNKIETQNIKLSLKVWRYTDPPNEGESEPAVLNLRLLSLMNLS